MDAASAVVPTFTVHPLVLGALVKIVPLTAAAAAFLGISAHPCGAVVEGNVQLVVASVLLDDGLVPVVTDSTPESAVPLTVAEAPVPAALPAVMPGAAPDPVTCCACTTLAAAVPPAVVEIVNTPDPFARK